MERLETGRLILRPFREEDLDDFYTYAKNPNVGPSAGWKPHESRQESESILKSLMERDGVWAIVEKRSGRVIGSVALHEDRKRENDEVRMLGYVLDETYWGQGLTTEAAQRVVRFAFEDLKLALLSVYHYPFNSGSKRVIEKCGFRYEGTLRRASRNYDGSIYDAVCYSITKEEYENEAKRNQAQ